MFDPKDIRIDVVSDKPIKGMWHTGPNAAWVTVTHLPTMISARMFDEMQHKARDSALACVELMVEQSRLLKCQFPETLAQTERMKAMQDAREADKDLI